MKSLMSVKCLILTLGHTYETRLGIFLSLREKRCHPNQLLIFFFFNVSVDCVCVVSDYCLPD